jgi:type IV pilus assembly protein PilW
MKRATSQRGFSVIELMVAMTLGLLVIGSVSALLVNSRKNYIVQDSVARLQENARFAMHVIKRDLRMAGYFGCHDSVAHVFNHVNGDDSTLYGATLPLEGFEQGGSKWYPSNSTSRVSEMLPGTDAITIRYAEGGDANQVLEPYMPNESAALHIPVGNGLDVGDIVAVTDCSSTDIFQITGPTQPDGTGTINHNTGTGSPGNATKPLSKTYEGDAFIMRLRAYRYFIGTGASGHPALFREALKLTGAGVTSIAAEELVEGVENMQILYGEDTFNNDRIPDIYRHAGAVSNWDNVVAVRVVLLGYTIASAVDTGGEYATGSDYDTTQTDGEKKYDLGFADQTTDEVTGTTGYRKRDRFVATVTLRNVR